MHAVDDLTGLWGLELDVIGHNAESAADLGEQAWAAQLRALSSLLNDSAAQTLQAAQLIRGLPGGAPLVPLSLPAPPAALPEAVRAMTDAAQAFWSAVATQTAAAMQPLQEGEDRDATAAATTRTGKARKPARHR